MFHFAYRRIPHGLLYLFLSLLIAGCGSSGGGDDSSGGGSPGGTASGQNSRLFVLDSGNGVVAALPSVPTDSSELTARILSSNHAFGGGIAYDSASDELYVSTAFPVTRIDVFDNASRLTGTITATRSITPGISNLVELQDLALDRAHDRLYVLASTHSEGVIAVFDNVSQVSGPAAPDRLIVNIGRGNFAIDFVRSILYNKNDGIHGGTIHAFDNVDTLNGILDYSGVRMILINTYVNISGLAIDPVNDRLYAAEEGNGIRVIESASTAGFIFGSGPFVYLDPPLISLPQALFNGNRLAFDAANDRLYAGFGAIVYTLNNASTLNSGNPSSNALMVTAPRGTMINGFAFP